MDDSIYVYIFDDAKGKIYCHKGQIIKNSHDKQMQQVSYRVTDFTDISNTSTSKKMVWVSVEEGKVLQGRYPNLYLNTRNDDQAKDIFMDYFKERLRLSTQMWDKKIESVHSSRICFR